MIINSLGLAATLIAVVDAGGSRFGFAWVRKHDTVLVVVDYTFYYYEHILLHLTFLFSYIIIISFVCLLVISSTIPI